MRTKMNLKEAMHAMIDGKRVKQSNWSDKTYCHYNEKFRSFYFSGAYFDKRVEEYFDDYKDGWEIVPQKVLKKFELWVNIYPTGKPGVHLGKIDADAFADPERLGKAEHIIIERWVDE